MRYPSVSVALCTYNGARFLDAQLASLAAQSYRPLELVVCDDRSTDDTLAVLAKFASTAPFPVHIVQNEAQLGYKANFKKAARLCRGELIAFCDQDDVWSPAKLEACCERFGDPDVVLVIHDAAVCDATGIPIGGTVYDGRLDAVLRAGHFEPWSSALGFTEVFRPSLLDVDGVQAVVDHWSGTELAHDQLVFVAALATGKVVFLRDVHAKYRQHTGNLYGASRFDLRRKIHYLRINRARDYEYFSQAAASRARFIEKRLNAGPTLEPFLEPEIAHRYERLTELYGMRARLYSSQHLFARLSITVAVFRAVPIC